MLAGNKKWRVFLIVSTGVFLATLDSSMVNIALPAIMADFQSTLAQTEWVVMAYLLTITSSLLFFGHLGDRLGREKIYCLGLIFFSLGSLGCALSGNFVCLIAGRFIQAGGASMMMATGPALIKLAFSPQQLGRGQGLIGIAVSFGLMSGPSLGGLLLHYFSWRSLFFLTLPISVICSIGAWFIFPKISMEKSRDKNFDWLGGGLWMALLLIVSLALTHEFAVRYTWIMLVCSSLVVLPLLFLFIKIESTTAHPILPISLFKEQYFSIGLVCALISFLVLFSGLILIPFYLSRILELSTPRIGLVMIAVPLAALVVSPTAGWLSDYLGARILSTLGLLILAFGMLLLAGLGLADSPFRVALCMAVLGLGQALFLSPNSSSVLGRTSGKQSGTAAALLATARNLGMLLGIALSGLCFSLFFSKLTGGLDMKNYRTEYAVQFIQALRYSFIGAALVSCIGVILSWQRPAFNRKE